MQNTNTVCLPIEIIRNTNLSPRARIVWAELTLLLDQNTYGCFMGNEPDPSLIQAAQAKVAHSTSQLRCLLYPCGGAGALARNTADCTGDFASYANVCNVKSALCDLYPCADGCPSKLYYAKDKNQLPVDQLTVINTKENCAAMK